MRPLELILELEPRSRLDMIDVTGRVRAELGEVFDRYRWVLYCSHHTTAGYPEQSLARRLQDRRERLDPFIRAFQRLFPREAGYRHDLLHLRPELSEAQREVEPRNADAHLVFIGCGLQSCVTYRQLPGVPVFFTDLDGVVDGRARTRETSVVAYDHEQPIADFEVRVPVSAHAVDSVNLRDRELGLMDRVERAVVELGIEHGRVDLVLDPAEHGAAITVNEYESLLMRHDLAEVLRDPLRFVAQQTRRVLADPLAVPVKTLGYARYDFVQVLNELLEAAGLGESALERLVHRVMALPAQRLLRLRRRVSLAVAGGGGGAPRLLQGRYQSPILMQWQAAPGRTRTVRVSVTRFE